MNARQIVALIGSAMVVLGVFLPLVSMPLLGSFNYFQNGRGDVVIVLLLAAAAIVLALADKTTPIPFLGIACAGVTAFTFFRLENALREAKARMAVDLRDNPFRGFADVAMESVQMQFGWAVLLLGAGLMLGTTLVKAPKSARRARPPAFVPLVFEQQQSPEPFTVIDDEERPA